jgi:lysozyme
MKISQKGLDLIKKFEGLSLRAYPDPASGGEPITIGYGSTLYPGGIKIKLGEVITLQRAEDLLRWEADHKGQKLIELLGGTVVNQNQFDSLLSFMYNCGSENLKKSTLLKKVKVNPNDPTIRNEFMRWINAAGKPMAGLKKRRELEANHYFAPIEN